MNFEKLSVTVIRLYLPSVGPIKSEYINLVWNMCLLPAPISLCINTTERADALSYRRDWFDSSDIEMTSVA